MNTTAPPSSPAPGLPLHLAELVLCYAPRVGGRLSSYTFDQLTCVLPRSLVPNSFRCHMLAANGFFARQPSSARIPQYSFDRLIKSLSPEKTVWVTNLLMPALVLPSRSARCLAIRSSYAHALTAAGALDALQVLVDRQVEIQTSRFISTASSNGHVHLLDWWKGADPAEFEDIADDCVERAFVRAAEAGHRDVLEWWLDERQVRRQVVKEAAIVAAGVGDLDCLYGLIQATDGWEWGSNRFWAAASRGGNVAILDFAVQNECPLPDRSSKVMDAASVAGHVHVLDWWFTNVQDQSKLYSHVALDEASKLGYLHVLDWWAKSGLELRFTPDGMQHAVAKERWDIVAWWQGLGAYKYMISGRPLSLDAEQLKKNRLVPKDSITLVSFGRLDWMQKLFRMTPTTGFAHVTHVQAIATMFGHVHVLEAYKHLFDGNDEREGRHESSFFGLTRAIESGHRSSIQWVVQNPACHSVSNWGWMKCVRIAARAGALGILVDLLSSPPIRQAVEDEGGIEEVFVAACRSNESQSATKILDFLHAQLGENPSESLTRRALKEALDARQAHVYQWWHQKEFVVAELTRSKLFQDAVLSGHTSIMEWFLFSDRYSRQPVKIGHDTIRSIVQEQKFETLYWITEEHRRLDLTVEDKLLVASALERSGGVWKCHDEFLQG